jgi:hypothetical protein
MYIRINIQTEAGKIFRQMAKEAGLGLHDMAEIAVYNLIGVWQKDRGIGVVPLDAGDVAHTGYAVASDPPLRLP